MPYFFNESLGNGELERATGEYYKQTKQEEDDRMALIYKELNKGDKIKYLGGDKADDGRDLTVGKIYEVSFISWEQAGIINNRNNIWYVSEYNEDCFELVENHEDKTLGLCVSLSKEIAKLRRELDELKQEIGDYKEYVEKDIAMLDERLSESKGEGGVFMTFNGSEYIDKLFGGDSE